MEIGSPRIMSSVVSVHDAPCCSLPDSMGAYLDRGWTIDEEGRWHQDPTIEVREREKAS